MLERRERMEEAKRKKATEGLNDEVSATHLEQKPEVPPASPSANTTVNIVPPVSEGIKYPPGVFPPAFESPPEPAYSGYRYGYGYPGAEDGGTDVNEPALQDSANYYYNYNAVNADYSSYDPNAYGDPGASWNNWNAGDAYPVDQANANASFYTQSNFQAASGDDQTLSAWGDSTSSSTVDAYASNMYTASCETEPYASPGVVDYYYEQAPVVDEYSIDLGGADYNEALGYDQPNEQAYGGNASGSWPWEEVFDPNTSQSYYYNHDTGETSWEPPRSQQTTQSYGS